LLQYFDAICRHQRPEFLVALRAPIEIGKSEAFVAFRTSQEYFNGSREDFLSYPVAGDGSDIVAAHPMLRCPSHAACGASKWLRIASMPCIVRGMRFSSIGRA
jgi:hypothetical protein